jgi:Domain of unknown function (DUF305)
VKQQLKQITIATATAALLATSPMFVSAEDASHEEHHSAGPAAESSDAANPGSTPKSDAPAGAKMGDSKMMGGMMGSEHMPKMMKMMQEMYGKMMGGGMQAQPKGDTGPSSQAFNGIMTKMHQDMAISYTGNADVDFVKAMIPHHQGAIDMAKTVVAFGKDNAVKKLAGDVIEAQEKEIAVLNDWITKHGQ